MQQSNTRTLSVSDVSLRLNRTLSLDDSVSNIKFVTDSRAQSFNKIGIYSVRDLFWHVPYRYLDFSHVVSCGMASVGDTVSIVGVVDKIVVKQPKPKLDIVEVYVVDETGIIRATFFRQPWVAKQVNKGDRIVVAGEVEFNFGFKQITSPFFEVLDSDNENFARVLPVHSSTEGISAAWMRRILSVATADFSDVCDYLPSYLVTKNHLMGRSAAFRAIHFPSSMHEKELARRRMAYDELFLLQIALLSRAYSNMGDKSAFEHSVNGAYFNKLLTSLPFTLTSQQALALSEICADMASKHVMNRLLLGDVGTGKTVVAALAIANCKDSGSQAALMAPTSILAAQHANKLIPLLESVGITAKLLVGTTPQSRRADIIRGVKEGSVDLLIGTTAMLNQEIEFNNLSLVVIDEQHRFGVEQRARLRQKGVACDLLSMTATPIPRTLALSIYGDMSISTIRSKPLGNANIKTKVLAVENEDIAFKAVERALDEGHQAYVVCPVIDGDDMGSDMQGEVVGIKANEDRRFYSAVIAKSRFEEMFPGKNIGLIHGKMKTAEKDSIMQDFYSADIDVLVSTTVVEVGVDVPNASVMIVYDADRFGLATLHQLRGRVGRSDIPSEMYLITPLRQKNPARERLGVMEKTQDGFTLAEYDLKQRHEGEILGYKQHGGISLNVVDMIEDEDLIKAAAQDAKTILYNDPKLEDVLNKTIKLEVEAMYDSYFSEVGHA